MMKKIVLIFLGIIGLTACNKTQTELGKKSEKSNQIESGTQLDFIKTFEGQINKKYDVVFKITSNGGQIEGNYFYKSIGTDIQLKGNLDNQGILTLNEYDKNGNQTGIFVGSMITNNKIEGNWSNSKGSKEMPFILIESNTQYETSKTQINNEKYESLSGIYEYEFNSTGVSFASIKIDYTKNNKFKFEISTAHESGCTGEESGTATIDVNGVGKYSSASCKLLLFKFTNRKLTIEETDCNSHGSRCGYSGEYIKTN